MDAYPIAASFNAVGKALCKNLAPNEGNVVLSPVSIGTALAMALSGARGETEREMREALGIPLDRSAMERASGELIAALCGYSHGDTTRIGQPHAAAAIDCDEMTLEEEQAAEESYRRDGLTHIAFANALLLRKGTEDRIRPEYETLVKASYAAEIMAGATLEEINGWASARTLGLVPQLLQNVSPTAVAYLLNTMVFVANWANPFDATLTRPGAFHLADGSRIEVPMMHQSASFLTAETDSWRALRLACLPTNIAFVVALPKDAKPLDFIDADEAEKAVLTREDWHPRRFAVALPRFKVQASCDLVDPLKAIGLQRAFCEGADFSGVADRVDLWIAQVQHGASIEIHETGIAAAAATVVEIVERGLPEPFDVDRPFLFYLIDDITGTVLMRGRVVDPRG